MKNFARVILNPKKERSLLLFHPWVFSGAVSKIEGDPEDGDIVEVFTHDGHYLATGHFHNGSIKVRIFSFVRTDAEQDFWLSKLKTAFDYRVKIGIANNPHTNIYRLVHGEGDGLPGLIIDMYDTAAIIQTHTSGMQKITAFLVEALKSIYGKKLNVVFDKSAETLGKKQLPPFENKFLYGNAETIVAIENDIRFNVNWVEGQKTGFFIDQRENRKLLERYSADKKVLNTFSYSGGFSMYALKGGASHVYSVDSSKKAADMAGMNAQLNGFDDRHTFIGEDVFNYFKKTEETYDIVILDPPAFAKHLSAVENAMVGYRNLNTEGIKKVNKGGFLFTFSCSQVIDRMLFRKLVFQAAAQTKRNVRIMHQLSQAPDHPINIYHPEGEYLKGLVLLID